MDAEGGRLFGSLLAALLLAAGLSKVGGAVAWRRWRVAARAVAAGRRARGAALSALLPGAELLTAGVLVADPGLGLVAGAFLLATLGVGVVVLQPRMAGSPCSCYGLLSHATIGTGLAVRNVSLSLLAVLASLPSLGGALSPPEVIAGAVIVGALLMGSAGVRGRGRVAVGQRLHGWTPRIDAPAVIVVLSPGCPSCERLAPMLAGFAAQHRMAALSVVLGAGPDAERARLAEAVGQAARRDLVRLVDRWRVPGTPWGIAIGADRRVVAVGPTPSLAELNELIRSLVESRDRVTRRAILRTGLGAAVASFAPRPVAALASAPKVRTQRRSPRARAARVTFNDSHHNNVFGTCVELADRIEVSGVYVPGSSHKGDGGYTAIQGFEPGDPPSKIPASVVNRRDQVEHVWKGYCPCDGTQYTDQTQCDVDCSNTLKCFGIQCVTTSEQWCVRSTYGVKLSDPDIMIYELHWYPTGKHKCPAYATAFNQAVQKHELHHAHDARDTVDDINNKYANRSERKCALTRAAAQRAVDAAIAEDMFAAQKAARQELDQKTDDFHDSPQGGPTKLNCRLCR